MKLIYKIIFILIFGFALVLYRLNPLGPVLEGKSLFFIFWFSMMAIFKIDDRVSVVFGLFMLLLTAFMILLDHHGFASRVAVYAFGFLAIGAFFQLISLLRERND